MYDLPNGIEPGDVIFANWKSGNFSDISHVGMITAVGNGQLSIAQHTINRIDSLLDWQNGGPDTHVWIVRPNQG
jgi:hypothetical protein